MNKSKFQADLELHTGCPIKSVKEVSAAYTGHKIEVKLQGIPGRKGTIWITPVTKALWTVANLEQTITQVKWHYTQFGPREDEDYAE